MGALKKLQASVERTYEMKPQTKDAPFWGRLEELDRRLGVALLQRPLTTMTIDNICNGAAKAFAGMLK
jgi:hypothetical protein